VANRGNGLPKPRHKALCRELLDTRLVIAVPLMNLLGPPGSTLLYLFLPPIRGSVDVDLLFPIICGTEMEETCNKNYINHGQCGTEVPA
jgi:hypothetical protein